MQVHYNEPARESSTTAKTALGLSIGALGVELLGAAGGGGILSGLRGGCRNSELEAEVARLKAEKYADYASINAFKESATALDKAQDENSAKFEKLFDELVRLRVNEARGEEQIKCLEQRLTASIQAGDQALANAIAVESERRMNGDTQIRDWVTCNYVPWKRVLDSTLLCPPVELAATSGGASNASPSQVVVSGTVTTQAASA